MIAVLTSDEPEERPQFGPPLLRPDGCRGGGAPRVGGVRVIGRLRRPSLERYREVRVLNGSVRPALRREPREAGGRPGRLEDQQMDVRARVPGGVRVPEGELVEQEQSVLVRCGPRRDAFTSIPNRPLRRSSISSKSIWFDPSRAWARRKSPTTTPVAIRRILGGRRPSQRRNGPERPSRPEGGSTRIETSCSIVVPSRPARRVQASSAALSFGATKIARFARTRPRRRGPRASGRSGWDRPRPVPDGDVHGERAARNARLLYPERGIRFAHAGGRRLPSAIPETSKHVLRIAQSVRGCSDPVGVYHRSSTEKARRDKLREAPLRSDQRRDPPTDQAGVRDDEGDHRQQVRPREDEPAPGDPRRHRPPQREG